MVGIRFLAMTAIFLFVATFTLAVGPARPHPMMGGIRCMSHISRSSPSGGGGVTISETCLKRNLDITDACLEETFYSPGILSPWDPHFECQYETEPPWYEKMRSLAIPSLHLEVLFASYTCFLVERCLYAGISCISVNNCSQIRRSYLVDIMFVTDDFL
jgi:hypothetical protein